MLWSVTIINFVGGLMALTSFLVPFFQVYRMKRFFFNDLFVTLTPFSKWSFVATAFLSAVSAIYMLIYLGVLMREDIFVFGLSSHDPAIEGTLCFTCAVYLISASAFFPSFYRGNKVATISCGCVNAVCTFILLLLACNSEENVASFVNEDGGQFDATLTPEDEQIMLAFHQMCSFIVFGHTLLMHAILWNIVYSRVPTKDLLSVPHPSRRKKRSSQ